MKTKGMEVTIVDCNKWYRGKGGGASFLLNERGCRCCLGFDLQRRGFDDASILNAQRPSEVSVEMNEEITGLTEWDDADTDVRDIRDTGICQFLMDINDDDSIDDSVRMRRLNDEAAEINLRFEFINVTT